MRTPPCQAMGRVTANRVIKLVCGLRLGRSPRIRPQRHNPTSGIVMNKKEGRKRFLAAAEIGLQVDTRAVKHAPKGATGGDGLLRDRGNRLLMLTGARLREILNLRWNEVDLDRDVLRLQ